MTRIVLVVALLVSGCATPEGSAFGLAHVLDLGPSAKPRAKGGSLLDLLLGPQEPASCPADGLVHLTDVIDAEQAASFVATMDACKGRRVAVEINSPGGSLFAALEIQKAIERHDKAVICVVDGMAASAAFVTLQSCATRYATDRSLLMAHHASLQVKGQERELLNGAAALHAIDAGMSAHCAKRMGMSAADFESHVSDGQEWYLDLTEGLSMHALDGEAENVSEVVRMVN